MIAEFEYIVLSILYCDIGTCFKELEGFLNKSTEDKKYDISFGEPDFKSIYYPSPLPGGSHMCKILLWEPENLKGKTAIFTNYQDGRYTLIFNYCRIFKRQAAMTSFSNARMLYPAFKMKYFDFLNDNEIERIIYLIKDGSRWAFFTKGPEQNFENLDYYAKKKNTEKFNKAIILEYLLKLGIDIVDKQFWQCEQKAIYFNQTKW